MLPEAADARLKPAGGSSAELRRRRGGGRAQASVLVALLLLVAVVVGVHVVPTHTSLEVRTLRRSRQRQLQAPASTIVEGDGSLYASAAAALDDEDDDGSSAEQQQQQQQQQQWGSMGGNLEDSGVERTMSFDVCRGFANQRIALISGLVLAKELNRSVVLPRLLLDGRKSSKDSSVHFGELFDLPAFIEGTQGAGLRIAAEEPPAQDVTTVHLSKDYNYMVSLFGIHAQEQHIRMECPSFRVPADLIMKHEQLVFAALEALKPVELLINIVERIEQRLMGEHKAKGYNVLYLNSGDEWLAHCRRWERITNGLARDNCDNNTDTVGDALMLHRVDRQVPLMVATNEGQLQQDLIQRALENLAANNFTVVLQQDVFEGIEGLSSLRREEAALVDYYIALRCKQFMGNSVSAASALTIMERWHVNKFATYYNGGNIPLELFMPLFPMPWVFTYNDWSAGTEYDQMVKGAVTSAIEMARMKPFCMFSGSETSEMYKWLVSKKVTIIRHEPTWKEALVKEGRRHRDEYTKSFSHLYKSDGALVGAFLRIDIPTLREFDQYNYVLFTDCDVYFRLPMKLVDWGTPLPTAIGMGYERYELFPYNDGVMLWNMPYMVKTNKKFVDFILSSKNSLYFAEYGPLDQGAFNQFYDKEVRGKPISKNFNAMIYHEFRPEARVVHLHGPKPNHYLEYLRTRRCQFHDMCQLGMDGSVCRYFKEYKRFVPEWPQAQALARLCGNLQAGVWHP